ncbi:MAG TPA: PEP-CTERM sorting domain-containing protein [Phycisphaerae bacterium]|nr:PEP-CTERM sorting domain-containing protein [Phycisphaerae bacterium]HNU44208.1 PEP-CTERM sorting domain-containing protein [Phycisphaerae bacterium]
MQPVKTYAMLAAMLCIGSALGTAAALADDPPPYIPVNLEWRPAWQMVAPGSAVQIGLYAVADSEEEEQKISAARVLFGWDPAYLLLEGLNQSGAAPLMVSTFPQNDPYGLNEANGSVPYRPLDGDGYYQAWAMLGDNLYATPAGTLLTTFVFTAMDYTAGTTLEIFETAGNPPGTSAVFDGNWANRNILAERGCAMVVIPEPATVLLLATGCLLWRRRR